MSKRERGGGLMKARTRPSSKGKLSKGGSTPLGYDTEAEVQRRYQEGAKRVQPALCCPTDYASEYLEVLPAEVIEKDYGCGDPTRWVREGETVVDLGSGAGKACYILAQKVGPHGKVTGVDFHDEMLALARKYQEEIAQKIGYRNVRFVKGKIQDLALDLERAERWLNEHPVRDVESLATFESLCETWRREEPMIADDSVDVVVSNCVLNLVRPQDKERLFLEIFRVLKRGGRAVISDIVCDEDPTEEIGSDPKLWSGCIAGAFREDRFLEMFEEAGFYGIEILSRQAEPWQVLDGVEFRPITVRAFKGKEGPCLERFQAVIYKGPWKAVLDDDGHKLIRGKRMAVCDKTFHIYTSPHGPYHAHLAAVPPRETIPLELAGPFHCKTSFRHPKQTKGEDYRKTLVSDAGPCADEGCC